ncbi:Mitochondrial fission protein [Coemansia aciculifera]|nr:Mitochondrial fission protein [Coemansia aciculifera]
MRRRSLGREPESSTYEHASQGFLVGLINRVLFRNGALIGLLRGNPRLLDSRPSKRPTPLSISTPLGTTPSLLSGFNSFLDHEHKPQTPRLEQSAEEFDLMLRNTPADVVPEVLMERREEYNEYLRKLESVRKDVVRRLNEVDERILAAVGERADIESRIAAMEGEARHEPAPPLSDRASVESEDVYEQDDVPRLRRLVHVFAGHYSGVTALDYDPVAGVVASGSLDTQVRVWDASGACKYVISGHSDIVRGVQFYERFLLTASNDSRIRMWDLSLLDSVQPVACAEPTTPPVTPTICRRVPPLDLCCESTFTGHGDAVTCFQARAGTLLSGSGDKTVREWDLATGQLRQAIDLTWATRDPSKSVRARRRGPACVARGTDGGDAGFVGALQFYECALATGTADGALRLWDLRTGQAHRQLFGHAQAVTSLQFDDRSVVTGSLDGTAVLWDLRMGRAVQSLEFGAPVTSVQLRRGLAPECWIAASDCMLHHYRSDSMQRVAYASDYGLLSDALLNDAHAPGAVVGRVYCQDGDTLLSGDSEGIVKLWKI